MDTSSTKNILQAYKDNQCTTSSKMVRPMITIITRFVSFALTLKVYHSLSYRRRMCLYRHKDIRFLIKEVIKLGGYSLVFSKVPSKHLAKGHLASIDSCAAMIQKFYFTQKGNFEIYMKAAARKAHNKHLEMLGEKAGVIQNSFRAHLWNLLMLAAKLNNRARRIQRAHRSYQYRYCLPPYYGNSGMFAHLTQS